VKRGDVSFDPIVNGWTVFAHCHGREERLTVGENDVLNGRIVAFERYLLDKAQAENHERGYMER